MFVLILATITAVSDTQWSRYDTTWYSRYSRRYFHCNTCHLLSIWWL